MEQPVSPVHLNNAQDQQLVAMDDGPVVVESSNTTTVPTKIKRIPSSAGGVTEARTQVSDT